MNPEMVDVESEIDRGYEELTNLMQKFSQISDKDKLFTALLAQAAFLSIYMETLAEDEMKGFMGLVQGVFNKHKALTDHGDDEKRATNGN